MNTHFFTRSQQAQRRVIAHAPQHHGKLTSKTVGRHPWSRTEEEFDKNVDDEYYVKQIQQLKAQLRQRDAELLERDTELQHQSAIIEALVCQMSEMEDLLEQKRRNTSTEKFHHYLTSLQEENEVLQNQVGYLESELMNARNQALLLKSELNSAYK